MKRHYFILPFVFSCFSFFGQTKQANLYADFQKSKPKYKKAILQEVLSANGEPYDTLLIETKDWTDREFKETTYYWLNPGSCKEGTRLYIYDPDKWNTVITKFFSCEKLNDQRRKIEYADSSVTYDDKADSVIFKLKYNRNGNVTTSYSLKGSKKRKVTIKDSTKITENYYENDTLLEKIIWFNQRNLTDSFLVFDRNNKLTTKVIERFNKNGDIIYEDRTENYENKTQVTKSKFVYVYDANKYWIKKSVSRKYFPKTDTDIQKTVLIRTLTY